MKKKLTITMSRRLVWREESRTTGAPVIDVRPEGQSAPARPKPAGWLAKVTRILLPVVVCAAGLHGQNSLNLVVVNALPNVAANNTATPVYSVVQQGNGFTAILSINGGRSGAGSGTAKAVVTLPSNVFTSFSPQGILTPSPAFTIAYSVNGTEYANSGSVKMSSNSDPPDGCHAERVLASVNLTCNPGRLYVESGHSYIQIDTIMQIGDASLSVHAFYNFGTPPAPTNVVIDGIVPIQVVTTPPNIPSMVPRKSTLIRAFLRNTAKDAQPITGVFGWLEAAEFPGDRIPALNYLYGTATAKPDPDEPNHSLNFLVPAGWLRSHTLTLTVSGFVPKQAGETFDLYITSKSPLVLNFDQRLVQKLLVEHLDVCFAGPDQPGLCPGIGSNAADLLSRALLPVSEDRYLYLELPLPPVYLPILKTEQDAEHLVTIVKTFEIVLRKLHGQGTNYRFIGAVHPDFILQMTTENFIVYNLNKSPSLFQDFCIDTITPVCLTLTNRSFANNMVKAFIGVDADGANIQGMGFNSGDLSIIPSTATNAVGATNGWLDTNAYDELTSEFLRISVATPTIASKPLPRNASDATDSIIVSGAIQADGSAGSLDPVIRLPQIAPGDINSNGTWCVRLHRASGTDIDSCFELDNSTARRSVFVTELPWYPDGARVSLFRKDSPSNELASLIASDPPFVSFAAPLPGDIWQGTQSVVWSGSDPAGLPLTYFPMYSSDGGLTWLPLGPKTDQQRFDFDTSQIAGGTNVFFRVIASNGLSNTIAEIGPIEVRQNPKLTVDTTPLDFGSHTTGYVGQTKLTLRNSGTGPLTLTSALPDGSPFQLIGMTQPLVIAAGHTRDIMVRYTPAAAGQHLADLGLTAADGTTTVITLKGSIADPAPPAASGPTIVAPANYDFGHLPVNTSKDLPLNIRNSGQTALQITGVSSDSAVFQPVTTTLTVPPNGAADLTVRVRPNAAVLAKGTLSLRTNDPNHAVVTIQVTVTGDAPSGPVIAMNPAPPFNFGSVQVNTSVDIQVTLTNSGGAPLTINTVTRANPLFTVVNALPLTVAPGTPQKMTIRFSPTAAGSPSDTWTLVTTPAAVIPPFTVSGTATAPATGLPVVAEPVSIAFANPPQDIFLKVSNPNSFEIRVTSAVFDDPRFTAVQPSRPFSVGSGSYQYLQIRYTPAGTTTAAGTLTLHAIDPTRPTLLISDTKVAVSGPAAPPSTGSACITPPANQVSWYSGDGNAQDLIGGNAGTAQGGTSYAAGQVGQAFQFDGSTGFVQLGSPANLKLTSGITLEAWINPRSIKLPTSQPMAGIITKWAQDYSDTANSDSYGLWLLPSAGKVNLFTAIHQTGGKEVAAQGGNVPFNTWTHVAMTFDSASGILAVYINGQQVASQTSPGLIFPTNHNVTIGREDSFLVRPFDGAIDEAGIYSRALSAAELQVIFNAGAAGKCKSAGGPVSSGPKIAVSASSLDFGSQPVNQPKTMTVTITNSGGGTLTVTALPALSAPFALVNPPAVPLNIPAAGQPITVSYTPTAAGTQTATLKITSNDSTGDASRSPLSIPITGTGTAAPPSGNPLATNLVGLFAMNEGSGTSTKNLVDGQVATFSGASLPTWNTADPSIVFKGGGAGNSYLNAGTDPAFDKLPTSQLTVVARINISTLSAAGICEKNDGNSADGFVFGVSGAGGALQLTVEFSGSNMKVESVAAVTAGKWIQVAATWDGTKGTAGDAHLYVNGVETKYTRTNPGSGTLDYTHATNQPFRIGTSSFDFPGSFNGKMAYLAVYRGRILTPAEMNQLDAKLPLP